ncbi:MAG: cysteine-rich small domain-containing protein [Brevinematales bacterium]|nr:cysteine-rich small domain-containing protein [Brevinematales bacterium]
MDKTAKNFFKKQIDFACRHFSFKDCPYYPCHKTKEELNCILCYCPFYPCNNKIGNGRWIITDKKKVFDCSECDFVHRDEVVKRIFELLYENKTLKQIAKIIKKEFKK